MNAGQLASAQAAPGRIFRPGHVRRSEMRAILSLATPIALVSLVNMAMSVTDTVMAAGLGAGALAAVAVGSDYYSVIFYFAAGVVSGIGPYYAAALANGDLERASRLRLSGWLAAALCAAVAVPVVWFAPQYLVAAGLHEGLLAEGRGYTRMMALTLVPMLVVTLYRTRLSAEERPGLLLRVTLAAVPLNAALNYVLMFGMAAWPGLGILGAGLSSLLVAGFIAFALIALGRSREPATLAAPRWREIAEVLRTGVQIAVATIAEVGIFLGATLFAATLGPADVAAHAVAIRAAGVAYALPTGLLQATLVRTSRAGALCVRMQCEANGLRARPRTGGGRRPVPAVHSRRFRAPSSCRCRQFGRHRVFAFVAGRADPAFSAAPRRSC
jgi:multidrug resistance protein, MATE family